MMEDNKKTEEFNENIDETNQTGDEAASSSTDVVENAIEVEDAKTDVRTDARPEVNEEVYDGVNRNSGCFGSFLRLMLIIGFLVGFVWFTLEFIAPSEERVEVYTKIEEATGFAVPTLNKVTVSDKQAMAEAEEDAAEETEGDVVYVDEFAEKEADTAELDTHVNQVIDQIITPGMSDLEKEKAVYDWMCANITYDYEAAANEVWDEGDTALGAIKNKKATCSGFSELFSYFMSELGIPCQIISGNTADSSHAWNKVCIDGTWYNVDTTFGATTGNSAAYFNKSDAEFAEDHFNGVVVDPYTYTY